MAQIGLNRKSNDVYLATYIALTGIDKKWNEIQDGDKIYAEIEKLIDNSKGTFKNYDMQLIMESDLVVDTVQNIMRIKCRHFSNTDMCKVFLLCSNVYDSVIGKINESIGCNVIKYVPPVFEETKTMSRKANDGKEMTNPQKVMMYLNSLEAGTFIKTKDIVVGSGLSEAQFKSCQKNPTVKGWLDSHKGDKRGSYVVK